MEVVRAGIEILVRPETINELPAMNGSAWSKRERGEHIHGAPWPTALERQRARW